MRLKHSSIYLLVLVLLAGIVFTACQPAEPEVVEKVVTQVIKETVVVEGTPQVVEKEVTVVVKEEVQVEKEVTRIVEVGETTEEEGPKYGGSLRFGVLEDPSTWNPYGTIDCIPEAIMSHIWSALLRYNGNSEIVGDLAESWYWEDETTLIFNLRQNVTWTNGDKFVADHVVKSMQLREDPEISLHAGNLSEIIEGWEALDDYTVKLTLKGPNVGILRMLTSVPGYGFIVHPDWDVNTCGQSAETTIGTGPFMYESYEPGISVKLVKNPNYFIEGMPYLDAIEHRVIPDAEARITALRAGDMDVASYIDFQSLPMLREDPNIFIPEGKGFYGSRLSFGLTLPPTDDVRVRHAINYAIDREMIVDAVVAGEGEAIWGSIIPEGRFGYDPDLADYYSYDPAKALELFNEAGWIDTDGDGILDKDGEPILITLVTYGPSWWSQTAEVFQANLRDIGVVLEINVLPWAEFAVVREEIAVLPEGEPDKYNLVGSSLWGLDMTDFVRYINGDLNQNRYHNSELNELMYSAISTLDDNDREKMFQEAQAMVLDDAPWITTCWVSRAEAVRSNVNNFMHLNDTGCFGILLWEAYLDD